MFKVVKEPTFTHDVEILEPSDGGHRKQKLKTTFRVVEDEVEHDSTASAVERAKDWLRRRIVAFHDLTDEDGKELPYSDDLRDQLLARPDIRLGLTLGYNNAINKALKGN